MDNKAALLALYKFVYTLFFSLSPSLSVRSIAKPKQTASIYSGEASKVFEILSITGNFKSIQIWFINYDALGNLFNIEIFEKPYNEYPLVSKQYDKNGKLNAVIYKKGNADEFVYNADGKFLGRWYINNYYNRNGKIIMKRSSSF